MKLNNETLVLYAVTNRSWLKGCSLSSQVEKAIKGGVTFIQLREKDLTHDDFLKEANAIKEISNKYNIPFVINDNVDIAVEVGADGVHIGQDDEELLEARRKLGSEKIIGVSVHSLEEAIKAESNGADYLGVGAMFNTSTKCDATSVSIDELENICSRVNIPVVAIGGITKKNILELKKANICGVAVISAIFAQDNDNIEKECKELFELSKEICK